MQEGEQAPDVRARSIVAPVGCRLPALPVALTVAWRAWRPSLGGVDIGCGAAL